MKRVSVLKIIMGIMTVMALIFLPVSCGNEPVEPPPIQMPEPPPPPPQTNNGNEEEEEEEDTEEEGKCEFEAVTPNLNDGTFDFECKGNPFLVSEKIGPDSDGGNWGVFGNGSQEADSEFLKVEYADNPSKTGINESDRVLKITEQPNVESWSGFFFDLAEVVDFPDGMNAISLQVWSAAPDQNVLLKLEDATDNTKFTESTVLTTQTEAWEELVYNFPPSDSGKYDRMTMIMNQGTINEAEVVYYLDNVAFATPNEEAEEEVEEATAPDVASPAPTLDAEGVISIFSDAYTGVEGTEFNPNWGQGTVATIEELVEGDSVLKYANLNFQGTSFESPIDLSSKASLHLDYWVSNSTSLDIYLINSGLVTGGEPDEKSYQLDLSKKSQWVSVDIPLSHFADMVDLSRVDQLKVDGDGTVYFDNIYFHGQGENSQDSDDDNQGDSTSNFNEAAPKPKHTSDMVISIFSDAYENVEGVDTNPSWDQSTVAEILPLSETESVLHYSNLNYQGIQYANENEGLDVSEMTHLHIDYYLVEATDLKFYLISTDPTREIHYSLPVDKKEEWLSVDIDLSEFTKGDNPVDLTKVWQFKIDEEGGDGSAEVYFDNIYFHKGMDSGDDMSTIGEPQDAAPKPEHDSKQVISIFSDAYTDAEGTEFNPNWGQQTVVTIEELVEGDSVLKYANLNYQGTQFSDPVDVSSSTHLHIDYWVLESTALNFFLINSANTTGGDAAEKAFSLKLDGKKQWLSVDIPLSHFSDVVDLTKVDQLKVDGDGTVYFDNIYFYMGKDSGDDKSAISEPQEAVSEPVHDSDKVISIFSDTYTDVQGTEFNPNWGQQTVATIEELVEGGSVLKYANLNYQGTLFSDPVDVSSLTHLHIDYWVLESTALNFFLINSSDITGGDPAEKAFVLELAGQEQWLSVDIPLSHFSDVVDLTKVDQLKVDGDGTVYFDNIYFYKGMDSGVDKSAISEPQEAVSEPVHASDRVISIFSDTYTDVQGTEFNPNWGQQTVATIEELVEGGSVLKYANLNYQGTQFSDPIDVSSSTHLHIDYWVLESTALNFFLINSANTTGGDAAEKAFSLKLDGKKQWLSVDIPLSDFSDVVDLSKVDQLKVDGDGTVYFDNIYFYQRMDSGDDMNAISEPEEEASEPVHDSEQVISIFSDAYTDVKGTEFNPSWGQQTVATIEELVKGGSVLKYANLNYQGTQFSDPIDASSLTHLHIDYWVLESTALNFFLINSSNITGADPAEKAFSLKLDGKKQWLSVDIPLSDFSDVVDLSKVDQLKVDGNGTVYFDNIYFYQRMDSGDDMSTIGEPQDAAPKPEHDSEQVISIFSDAYTDLEGTEFTPNWGQSTVAKIEELAEAGSVLKYANLDYQGTQFSDPVDASSLTHLHIDYWVLESTALNFFLINSGNITGGDPAEKAFVLELDSQKQWLSVDIPLSDFSDVVDLSMVDQLKVDGNGTVYFDNIYFFEEE